MRKRTLILAVVLALLVAAPAVTAWADDAISIASNSFLNEFPNEIRFKVEASAGQEITKVALYYKLQGSAIVTYAYPKFDPGKRVSVEYVWNTQRKYIPPGVEVRYYWILEDAAGNSVKTSSTSFVIEDVRFKWRNLPQDKISLFWYEGDAAFGQRLMGVSLEALDQLGRDVGVSVEEPVKIYIYANKKDLLGALEPKAQEWTGGRSFSEQGIIALMVEPNNDGISWAARAIPHELSHVVVHQAIKNPYGDIPHWLDEGLAMHAEGAPEAPYRRLLDRAIKQGNLISLKSLASNFPADPDQATLSYAQSQSVVEFILSRYGSEKMTQLLAIFREGSTYDDAVQTALGTDIAGLDAAWRASLGVEPAAIPAAAPESASAPQQGSPAQPQSPGICLGIGQVLGLVVIALAAAAKWLPFHLGM